MKLDVDVLRYLSRDDFRVLTAVEMGMRNVSIENDGPHFFGFMLLYLFIIGLSFHYTSPMYTLFVFSMKLSLPSWSIVLLLSSMLSKLFYRCCQYCFSLSWHFNFQHLS